MAARRYDEIGLGYARTRRADPRLAAVIERALGDARTVVNLGAGAGLLPLRDASVDAAMAVLSVHHWDEETEDGVRELRRVARGRVVIVTFDVEVCSRMWLAAEYLPEVTATDRRTFPSPARLAEWLAGSTRVARWPIPRDCSDWTFAAFWAHPERVLDREIAGATSGMARLDPAVRERAMRALAADLADGTWEARHGHLRGLHSYDAGLRVVINEPDDAS